MPPERHPEVRPPRSRTRRLLGCFVTVPLGCLAFFGGAIFVVMAMTPRWISGGVARGLSEAFGEEHAGKLEIGDLELSWFERCVARDAVLSTADGETVVRASIETPSLVDLLEKELRDFGQVDVVIEQLDIRVGADGRTNLERALERRGTRRSEELTLHFDRETWRQGRVDVRLNSLRWTDERAAGSERVELEGLTAKVDLRRGGEVRVEAIGGGEAGVDVALTWVLAGSRAARLDVERLNAKRLPSALLPDGLIAGLFGGSFDGRLGGGTLARVLGPTFRIAGSAREPAEGAGAVHVELGSARAELVLDGVLDAGWFASTEDGFRGTLQWTDELALLIGGDALRELGLERAPDAGPVTLAASFGASRAALFSRAPAEPRAQVAGLELELRLDLGPWRCRRAGETVELPSVRLVSHAFERDGALALDAALADESGALSLSLTSADLLPLTRVLGGQRADAADLALEVRALPDSAFARWLGADVAVELSGARLELVSAVTRPGSGSALGRTELDLRLVAARAALAHRERAGAELALESVEVELRRQPARDASGRARLVWDARIQSALLGDRADRAEVRGGWVRGEDGTAVLNLFAPSLPARLADAWLGLDGLLTDVFGADLQQVRAEIAPGPRPGLLLTARSETAELSVQGEVDGGALIAREGQRSSLSFRPTPVASRRLLAPLLPLFRGIESVDGSPVELRVASYRLPLDGDASELSAAVELEHGRVRYEVLPELAKRLELVEADARGELPAGVLRFGLDRGLARHERLAIPVGGGSIDFGGTCSLESGELNLTGQVPIHTLIRDKPLLVEVQKRLGAEAAAAVAVHGNRSAPSVLVDTYGFSHLMFDWVENGIRGFWVENGIRLFTAPTAKKP